MALLHAGGRRRGATSATRAWKGGGGSELASNGALCARTCAPCSCVRADGQRGAQPGQDLQGKGQGVWRAGAVQPGERSVRVRVPLLSTSPGAGFLRWSALLSSSKRTKAREGGGSATASVVPCVCACRRPSWAALRAWASSRWSSACGCRRWGAPACSSCSSTATTCGPSCGATRAGARSRCAGVGHTASHVTGGGAVLDKPFARAVTCCAGGGQLAGRGGERRRGAVAGPDAARAQRARQDPLHHGRQLEPAVLLHASATFILLSATFTLLYMIFLERSSVRWLDTSLVAGSRGRACRVRVRK